MTCSQLLAFALAGAVGICQSVSIRQANDPDATTPEWIRNVSFALPGNGIPNHRTATAVVTFAGKKNPEYIDGAVMLGMSVKEHLPEYPMVAMIIDGMKNKYKTLLKNVGWQTVSVPNWDQEYCGKDCDSEFLGRWHDSFEKINAFRLPFARVLFMDSDTYIFRSHVKWLVTKLELPTDHIAMARDGCKDEYNSGVMLFRPGVGVFQRMLKMVTERRREQVLDQSLVNAAYRGKIVEIDREFNCVDTVGIQPGTTGKQCEHRCSKNAVVAHFTGHPKPTAAKRRLLEMVRRPGAPALACMNTNFGSCAKWSDFYCDIRKYKDHLSDELQHELKSTEPCCHPDRFSEKVGRKFSERNWETCLECPATMEIKFQHRKAEELLWTEAMRGNVKYLEGTYVKTNIPSGKFNGGRPIYFHQESSPNEPVYMYFIQSNVVWAIGADYAKKDGVGFAGMEAQCPRDTKYWSFHNGTGFERRHVDIRPVKNLHNPPSDTNHILWNLTSLSWEREQVVWEHDNATDTDEEDEAE